MTRKHGYFYQPLLGPYCLFCAAPADQKHHTPPIYMMHNPIWHTFDPPRYKLLVSVCAECNHILGKWCNWRLHEQARYILRDLNKRSYVPRWTEEEIDELGPGLQSRVEAAQRAAAEGTSRSSRVLRRQGMLLVWESVQGDPADLETLLHRQVPIRLPQSLDKKANPSSPGW